MKTKFNLLAAFVAVIVCFGLSGCKKVTVDTVETPESEYYTVELGMSGDIIDVIESPLRRAGNGEADLYGIQVYSAPNKDLPEGQYVTWTNYAYGVFDSGKDLKINLLKGKKYKFVATMVVDGQEKINNYSNSYSWPFFVSGTNSDYGLLSEQFTYQHADYLGSLGDSYANLLNSGSYYHPNVERFYGELLDFVPGKNNSKAMIKMKSVTFGAKFIAHGKLAKEGTLEIQMTDAPKMTIDLTTNDKKVSDVFTLQNIYQAYNDNNYTETVAVTLNWHRPDGTVFPLGTHEVTFKRNKMTTVQVKIETENAESELGVEIDDTDMTEDDEVTNIEDGELVDTDVDLNA